MRELDPLIEIRQSERDELEAKLAAAEKENTELKAKLWVAKDSQLRTYDGLTEKADKYDALLSLAREMRSALANNLDSSDCRFDHNGNCQEHYNFGHDAGCDVADAKLVMAKADALLLEDKNEK